MASGVCSTDQVANARNLHILGTPAANGTATLDRDGAGQIGTAPLSGSGSWNLDSSGS